MHRSSAASLRAARIVLEKYNITVRPPESLVSGAIPNLTNSEACVSVIIDYATNVFHLSLIRPELRYWQERLFNSTASASQIAGFLQKVIETFNLIPKRKQEESPMVATLTLPPEFRSRPVTQEVSKASIEASRFIFHYYAVTPKDGEVDDSMDRKNVAVLVESSIGISKAMDALPLVAETQSELRGGNATEGSIKKCLRQLGVALAYIPTYEERDEEVKLL